MRKINYIFGIVLVGVFAIMTIAHGDPLTALSDEFEDSSTLANWQRINETEGWNADQLEVLDIDTSQTGRMMLRPHTVTWFQDYRGSLVYKEVSGDFVMTTSIHVSDLNPDPDLIPDANFSLAGLMLRVPRPINDPAQDWELGGENYIFVSVGVGFPPSVNVQWHFEVKNTVNSVSALDLPLTNSGNARLQIARIGDIYAILVQPEDGDWQVRTLTRQDMAGPLQAGAVAYTDFSVAQIASGNDPFVHNSSVFNNQGNPDIEAGYDYIRFAEIPDELLAVDLTSLSEGDLHDLLLLHLGDNVDQAPDSNLLVTRFDDPSPDSCSVDDCSLREAILAANDSPGENVVLLPAGTYLLSIAGRGENVGQTGDLDIREDLTIIGSGAKNTVIDGSRIDRVFDIKSNVDASMSGLTIQNGLLGCSLNRSIQGGGINVRRGANLKLNDVTVRNNRAMLGSGIYSAGRLDISTSLITLNSSVCPSRGSTAAIHIENVTPSFNIDLQSTLTDSTVSFNQGVMGGGIAMGPRGVNVTINRSLFSNNTSSRGGGIYAHGGRLDVVNSTFYQNGSSQLGGALFNRSANIVLSNVTMSENMTGRGGVSIYAGWGGNVALANTIVTGSAPMGHCFGNRLSSSGHNLYSGTTCPSNGALGDINNTLPLLDKLDYYGGATRSLALLANSPAINAGSDAICREALVGNIDQRGIVRIGGSLGNSHCDIGAFEWHPVANATAALGTNLGAIRDFSTELPFVDIFKQSRPWTPVCLTNQQGCANAGSNTGEPINTDEQGWVTSLPSPSDPPIYTTARAYLFAGQVDSSYRAGQYILTFDGSGNIQYGGAISLVQSSPGRHIINIAASGNAYLDITATDPNDTGDYIRNIRVVRSDLEVDSQTHQFTPVFLDKARHFSVLRFMDWMRTNENPPGEWSNRAKVEDATFAVNGGVPLEVMIELANRMQAHPWFSLPDTASDYYMEQFATMVRDRLNSDLSVYVEYSNETWNNQFTQTNRVRDAGVLEFPNADNRVVAGANRQGQKTVEMCSIWDQAWGDQSDRLICVNAARANPDPVGRIGGPNSPFVSSVEHVLNCQHWSGGPCNSQNGVDAIAIAPYIGSYIGSDSNGQTVLGWANDTVGGLDTLFDELNQGNGLTAGGQTLFNGALQRAREWMAENQTSLIDHTHGVQMIAYEGGQHLVGSRQDNNNDGLVVRENDAITSIFNRANRDSRMGDAYEQYLNDWKNAGGCLFVNYTLAWTGYNENGSWGILEFIDQVSTPKYDTVTDFIAANPFPWSTCDPLNLTP